jgi:hypothetical protein
MELLLQEATELPLHMYSQLTNPKFKGQTSMNDDGCYWVVMESEGKLFKFHLFC